MKKYFGWILVVAVSITVLAIANQASTRQVSHETEKKYVAPTPPGPSEWCTKHPEACLPKDPRCHPVDSATDACQDAKGNGDGFVCSWELRLFKDECSDAK